MPTGALLDHQTGIRCIVNDGAHPNAFAADLAEHART
jgi:hypothetical protein